MFKLSLASRVLDVLGRFFIFTPQERGLPHDFFYVPGDRYLPSASDLVKASSQPARIATDAFRRRLLTATAWASSGVASILCVALYTVALLINVAHH